MRSLIDKMFARITNHPATVAIVRKAKAINHQDRINLLEDDLKKTNQAIQILRHHRLRTKKRLQAAQLEDPVTSKATHHA